MKVSRFPWWFGAAAMITVAAIVAALIVDDSSRQRLSAAGDFASGVAAAFALAAAALAIVLTQYNESAEADATREAWHSLKLLDEALCVWAYQWNVAQSVQRSDNGVEADAATRNSALGGIKAAADIVVKAIAETRNSGAIRWFYDRTIPVYAGGTGLIVIDPEVVDAPEVEGNGEISLAELLTMLEVHLRESLESGELELLTKQNFIAWPGVVQRHAARATEDELRNIWERGINREAQSFYQRAERILAEST